MNVLDQLDALMRDTVPPVLTAPQSVRDRWRWAMRKQTWPGPRWPAQKNVTHHPEAGAGEPPDRRRVAFIREIEE
jgi:hypothetical protein